MKEGGGTAKVSFWLRQGNETGVRQVTNTKMPGRERNHLQSETTGTSRSNCGGASPIVKHCDKMEEVTKSKTGATFRRGSRRGEGATRGEKTICRVVRKIKKAKNQLS